jgi:hypothetical protein
MALGAKMTHSGSVVPYIVFGLLSIPLQAWVIYLLFRGTWDMLKSQWQQLRTTRAKRVYIGSWAVFAIAMALIVIGLLARG